MQIALDKNWSTSATRWIFEGNQRVSLTPAPVEQCLSISLPVPIDDTFERIDFAACDHERENHCIPIDPRVNEAVEWWPLTGAFTGLRIILARCQRVFSLAYVFVPSPPLSSPPHSPFPPPSLRFFSFFLLALRRSVWIAFWREFPLSFSPTTCTAFPAFLRSRTIREFRAALSRLRREREGRRDHIVSMLFEVVNYAWKLKMYGLADLGLFEVRDTSDCSTEMESLCSQALCGVKETCKKTVNRVPSPLTTVQF